MLRSLYGKVGLPVLLCVILTGITLFQNMPAYAATITSVASSRSSLQTGTTTTITNLNLPQSECDQLKSSYPSLANNPNLCVIVHESTQTISKSPSLSNAASVSPYASGVCGSYTIYYDDKYTGWLFGGGSVYQMEYNPTFVYTAATATPWPGCNWKSPPDLVAPNICRMDNGIGVGFSITNIGCADYYTGIPSHAAFQSWYQNTSFLGVNASSYRFQRRECYVNPIANPCDYAWQ